MNPKILNKDFQHPSDGWYQIEPKGDHPNRAAGVVQVIDEEAVSTIVNRFNTDAQAGSLRHGNELLVDHEHFSDQPDQESRAYGWLQELQNRADGIYGRIRWTATGKAAVDGGDYRFFSTEYDPEDVKVINAAKGIRRIRPIRLSGLSLTNMNNNRGQRPITNRGGDASSPDTFAAASAAAGNQNQNQQPRQQMKSVCTLLGLSAEADEASVHAAVSKIINRGDITPDGLTTLRAEYKSLGEQNQTLLGEQVDALLDAHGVKEEKVRNRLKPVIVAMKNRDERVSALVDFGFKAIEPGKEKTAVRMLNRKDGKPAAEAESESGTDEQAVAEKIRNRATELQHGTPGRNWDSCWSQASREITTPAK